MHSESKLSRLESLPAELRVMILSFVPDLTSLRALNMASWVMYWEYEGSRDKILRACLKRELDGLFLDAMVMECCSSKDLRPIVSWKLYDGDIVNPELNTKLSDYYSSIESSCFHELDQIPFERVQWLANYHRQVVRPLSSMYAEWALSSVPHMDYVDYGGVESYFLKSVDAKTEGAGARTARTIGVQVELSRSEEVRIFKALYRFETYTLLFGHRANQSVVQPSFEDELRLKDARQQFPSLFEPWEAEAIWCFAGHFLTSKYDEMLDVACETLQHRFGRNLSLLWRCLGLEQAVKSFKTRDVSQLLNISRCFLGMRNCTERYFRYFDDCFSWQAQNDRRLNHIVEQDRYEQQRQPMPFVGDHEPARNPPLGWVLTWRGKYSNLYGGYLPSNTGRWGYVCWDEKRLTDIGGDTVAATTWTRATYTFEGHALIQEIGRQFGWSPVRFLSDDSESSASESTDT